MLFEDSVGQLRWLNRQACVHNGTIRSQRCRRWISCGTDTAHREFRVGDTFHDRRQPGHQDAAASGPAAGQQLPGTVVQIDRNKQRLSKLCSGMALPRCVVQKKQRHERAGVSEDEVLEKERDRHPLLGNLSGNVVVHPTSV